MSKPTTSNNEASLDEILDSLRLYAMATNDQEFLHKHFKEAKAQLQIMLDKARAEELVSTCLAGMGGLTPQQQTYIEKRLKALKGEL